jgi:hypothetical protein
MGTKEYNRNIIVQTCQGTSPHMAEMIIAETRRSTSLLFLLLIFFTSGMRAQSLNVAELSVDTNYLRLGQQTVLKFSVTCSKDRKPIIPNWKEVLNGELEIISAGNADTISITDSELKIRQELVVAKFNEDTLVLDSLMVPLIKKRDTVFVMANTLTVYPILEDVDMNNDFRDIKAPVDVPYTWQEMLPYILLFMGIILLCLIIWIIVRIVKRSRKKKVEYVEPEPPKPVIPAHIIALEKLQKLRTEEKWFTTDSKLYITELTDILREYIFNRWGFDAQESTSEEILAAEFILSVEHNHLQTLKDILATADFVKFAKANTSTDENKLMLEKAIMFVELTQSKEESSAQNE